MHQGLCYRIGASDEVVTKHTRESFLKLINMHGVGYGRIKVRKSFTFQFMEFSFTKSFELKDTPETN